MDYRPFLQTLSIPISTIAGLCVISGGISQNPQLVLASLPPLMGAGVLAYKCDVWEEKPPKPVWNNELVVELPTYSPGAVEQTTYSGAMSDYRLPYTPRYVPTPVYDPVESLVRRPTSALIVGVPGSGKGMLVSNAMSELRLRFPELHITVIDPKADPNEAGYWDGCDSYRIPRDDSGNPVRLKKLGPDEASRWVLEEMELWEKQPSPKLLIFDELLMVVAMLKLSDSKLRYLPSFKANLLDVLTQGDSRREWVWGLGQSMMVEELGISSGLRGNFHLVGLLAPHNRTAVQSFISCKGIPKVDGGLKSLMDMMDASPSKRIIFDGKINRWEPMPILNNRSGFDRDAVNDTSSTSSPQTRLLEVETKLVAKIKESDGGVTVSKVQGWKYCEPNTAENVRSILNQLVGSEILGMEGKRYYSKS